MNNLRKIEMQQTGKCDVDGLTVLEIAEIVSDLGLDPRAVRVYGRAVPRSPVDLVVTEDRLAAGQSVTLR